MAGELGNTAENGLLDHALLKAAFEFSGASRYLGIHIGDPGEDGQSGSEATAAGYARTQMVGADWNAAAGRAITNSGDSNTWANGGFGQLSAAITNATHWTLWRTLAGTGAGDFLGRFPFPAPQTFPNGSTPIVEDSSLSAGWTANNGLRTYSANLLLDHLMLKQEWDIGAEQRFAYLSWADPGVAGAPVEPGTGAYARPAVPGTTWANTANGANNNANAIIQFPKATANWLSGNATHNGLADASSGGNLIFAWDLTTPFEVLANGRVSYATGDYQFTIN